MTQPAGLRPSPPCAIVMFGAAGDLTKRKLLPAIYNLKASGFLPRQLAVVGVTRKEKSHEQFREEQSKDIREFATRPVDEALWKEIRGALYYQAGEFTDPATYSKLGALLEDVARDHATGGNVLFYLATPPDFFGEIVKRLGEAGLTEQTDDAWRRVVIEKPFGHDFDSARALNAELRAVLEESQIYRIDHYLGKETVRNILVFRFGNGIFEPIWHRRYVDHVQITVAESIGVEKRGSFYEEAGASRDFLQNHLMQLLALVAMEPPATFDADALRDEKVKVLRAIEPMTPADVAANVVRGQYGPGWVAGEPVAGYRGEPQVDPASETETFVAARLFVDDWRWAGVPFYLRAGKRLPKRATEIAIQFKQVPHALFKDSNADPEANLLALRIQPDEGILLRFAAKVPGLGVDVRSVNMDFTYGSAFSVDSPDAYETLILDALLGDAALFTRSDEVEKAWGIVTPVIEAWADEPPPAFPDYAAGSWGPDAADALLARDGRRWRRI